MKVLMLQHVKKVGQKDSIVDVSDGFALNSLIPDGKAVQATAEQITSLAKRQLSQGKEHANKQDLARKTLKKLEGVEVVVLAKANTQGSLFKGLTKGDIAKALSEFAKAHVDTAWIQEPAAPLKQLGTFLVRLESSGVKATTRLLVESSREK